MYGVWVDELTYTRGLGGKARAAMPGPQRRMNDIRGGSTDGTSVMGGSQEEQQSILQQARPTMDMSRDVEQPEFHPASHFRNSEIMSEPPSKILPREERYPFCIVWSPLGPITSCFPYVGHMGICDSRGYIWDFQGPYAIGRDNMAFGNPTRILQLNPELCKGRKKDQSPAEFWDSCLHESNCIYSRRMHNICCDNCHSHVAVALEKMQYAGLSHWNMIMLGAWVFFCGKFPPPVFPRFAWSCCPTIILALIVVFFYGLGNGSPR